MYSSPMGPLYSAPLFGAPHGARFMHRGNGGCVPVKGPSRCAHASPPPPPSAIAGGCKRPVMSGLQCPEGCRRGWRGDRRRPGVHRLCSPGHAPSPAKVGRPRRGCAGGPLPVCIQGPQCWMRCALGPPHQGPPHDPLCLSAPLICVLCVVTVALGSIVCSTASMSFRRPVLASCIGVACCTPYLSDQCFVRAILSPLISVPPFLCTFPQWLDVGLDFVCGWLPCVRHFQALPSQIPSSKDVSCRSRCISWHQFELILTTPPPPCALSKHGVGVELPFLGIFGTAVFVVPDVTWGLKTVYHTLPPDDVCFDMILSHSCSFPSTACRHLHLRDLLDVGDHVCLPSCVPHAGTVLSKHGVGVDPLFCLVFWDRGRACARGGRGMCHIRG